MTISPVSRPWTPTSRNHPYDRRVGASSPKGDVTGLAGVAQTLVNIGVDLGKMTTVGDLQGGIEEAERLLGYKVLPMREPETA